MHAGLSLGCSGVIGEQHAGPSSINAHFTMEIGVPNRIATHEEQKVKSMASCAEVFIDGYERVRTMEYEHSSSIK